MKDYETDPNSIWKSEIFGRSLDEIVKLLAARHQQ